MCGIIGYIGMQNATPILVDGLRRLEYRGYDSTGIAVKNGDISIHKRTGKVADLETILPKKIEGTCGIAHTRWATHGGVTAANAHPHASEDGKVAIIHNGIIENASRIRKYLQSEGVKFSSETDSEVLVHLIHRYLEGGSAPLTAVRIAIGYSFAFASLTALMCLNHSPVLSPLSATMS